MRFKPRYVQAEVEIYCWELTEEEIDEIKETLQRILRICNLVPQEFDRKAVKDLTSGLIEMFGDIG